MSELPQITANSAKKLPEIYKEEEYGLMIELINSGIWKTVNLEKALHIDRNTITTWKERPEAIAAHRQAILKFVKRRTDVEKILKELEMEVETDIPSLVQNNYYQLNDEQLDQLIEQKLRQVGAGITLSGEGKKDQGKSA